VELERVALRFAGGRVRFADREAALKWFESLAESGGVVPEVIYGPEGAGKTALFRQAFHLLAGKGYGVALVSPLAERPGERLLLSQELASALGNVAALAYGAPAGRLVELAFEAAYRALRRLLVRRIAVIMDDVFQAVGLGEAERLVKEALNAMKYPDVDYEKIIIVFGSSEGATRFALGRHEWASLRLLWNIGRNGFEELYSQLAGPKPEVEEAWLLTGGNPGSLERLYLKRWKWEAAAAEIAAWRGLGLMVRRLTRLQREALREAVEDPDSLYHRLSDAESEEERDEVKRLIDELSERNLITLELPPRVEGLWLDNPPPERALELGVGRHVAWQTPLHREAVRLALRELGAV